MGMIVVKKEVLESWLKNKSTPPRNFSEMADSLGISQAMFSYILNCKRQVTTTVLRKLCDLTGYQPGDLCLYDRTREPEEDTEK